MSLAKTDAGVAERFLALGGRPDLSELILTELARTTAAVLRVVGQDRLLGGKPRLRDALEMRMAPANALSYLQWRALSDLRAGRGDDRTQDLLLRTVNGVAAALQNTG